MCEEPISENETDDCFSNVIRNINFNGGLMNISVCVSAREREREREKKNLCPESPEKKIQLQSVKKHVHACVCGSGLLSSAIIRTEH